MKAVVLTKIGRIDHLTYEDMSDPVAGHNEVIVRVRAAALNHRDVFICEGKYAKINVPIILGSDGAGEVHSVGNGVDRSWLGRKVVIYPSINWGDEDRVQSSDHRILGLPDNGTLAQFVKVPASNIFDMPHGLTFEEAGAIPLASLTAYRAIVTRGNVQPGETVLVAGIGGGVATFVMQIALSRGARVLVTSGDDAKIERAVKLGASGGANYRDEKWKENIAGLSGGKGPDVVVESAGGESFDHALHVVKPGGRVVTYGATLGPVKHLEVRRIFWKQLSILGATMGTPDDFQNAIGLFGEGKLKPVIDRVFTLQEAIAAFRRLQEAEQFGKVVLRVD